MNEQENQDIDWYNRWWEEFKKLVGTPSNCAIEKFYINNPNGIACVTCTCERCKCRI